MNTNSRKYPFFIILLLILIACNNDQEQQKETLPQPSVLEKNKDKEQASESQTENKQAMAQSPEELLDALENLSFLKPAVLEAKMIELMNNHATTLGLQPIPQLVKESSDPRNSISETEILKYSDVLKEIALESKKDGEILWGRIQATKYERKSHDWIFNTLKSMGIEDVHHDKFPTQFPQWRPTACDLEVVAAPTFKAGETYIFKDAITAFISGTTASEGVEREIIYVGEGTAAELMGRDLSNKIILLRGSTLPSAMLSTARTAYSRVASGRYGKPDGIVVWWDVPKSKQVAGRIGAPGGGDAIGKAVPWTSIGNDQGLYLRKLLDRATPENPVKVKMNIQGQMESGKDRMTGNVYAKLPGKSGKFIVIPTHVDGYFYGIHDNGACVALNLALANYFSKMPFDKREHGIIFFFEGDHEVPGVGGTLPYVNSHKAFLKDSLLLTLRPEHLGMVRPLYEGVFVGTSNITEPVMLTNTNQSPLLNELFLEAARRYTLSIGDVLVIEPFADEAAFHPPFHDIGAISAGWIQSSKFYHSSADVDWETIGWGGVNFKQMEKFTRAHAFIIEELFNYSKADLERGGKPVPKIPIYQSDLLKMYMGNN